MFDKNEVECKRTFFYFEISYELKVIKERERVCMINNRIYTRDKTYIFSIRLKERIDWEINSKSENKNKFNLDLDKRLVWVLPLDNRDEK